MIVCLCEGVSSSELEAALLRGASTVRALSQATRAGTGCGSCACDLRSMLRERRRACAPAAPACAPPEPELLAAK